VDIGERIKSIRKEKNLTLAKFGQRIQMSESNLSRIEKGDYTVTDKNIALICDRFDVNEEWLRTGAGDKYKELREEEKLMKFVRELIKDDDDTLQKTAMILPNLTEDQLKAMYQMALVLQEKNTTPE